MEEEMKNNLGNVPPVPPPPLCSNKTQSLERKDICKSAATLLSHNLHNFEEKSALNVCEEFLQRHRQAEELSKKRWFYHNNDVKSCLQDGPTCGLVALKLAAEIIKGDQYCDEVTSLLRVAKDNCFTKNGEMFSAKEMGLLAKIFYNIKYKVIEEGIKDHQRLLEHLYRGYPVLIPYDADRNHEPCLKQGHKAHWAVLTGFLFSFGKEIHSSREYNNVVEINSFQCETRDFSHSYGTNYLYLLARQGKSRHYSVWSWLDLHDSNKNLLKFPQLCLDEGTTTLQSDHVENGLRSKAVFLFPADNK